MLNMDDRMGRAARQARLAALLRSYGSVLVAYSGGLDSAFLLKSALDVLGRDHVLAVTARSETYPLAEYRDAQAFARRIGARRATIRTSELAIEHFSANPENRCYYCKKELFAKLKAIARTKGIAHVVDGTNRDDLRDVRYGRKAARELGIKSPLVDAGMTKRDIRALSRRARLPTWNKPPFACLASRFPFQTPITAAGLARVEKAEAFLRAIGVTQIRVRHHGSVARIEVLPRDFRLIMRHAPAITARFKRIGFTYTTLDLAGYRTGSMHENR